MFKTILMTGFLVPSVLLLLMTELVIEHLLAFEPETTPQITCYQDVCRVAEQRAAVAYQPQPDGNEYLSGLSYDQYVSIQFNRNKAVWKAQTNPFWLEGFHQGFVQRTQVQINLLDQGKEIPFQYQKSLFRFGKKIEQDRIPDNAGFAGLRVLAHDNELGKHDEFLTFLGASYFRARSSNTVYGTSNRGLAIDVGMNRPEEFPVFRELWVSRPYADATRLQILAFMDTPSLTGAYLFEFEPGSQITKIDVQGRLYFREIPEKLALAPLTSMWMWGDGIAPPPKDKRPHVHDSDGLLIQNGTDWNWRTLSRQTYPSVMSFPTQELQGYGLIQRETAEKYYQDSGALYHQRPSIWVEPVGGWPAGRVELLELPGIHEGIDSVGAYWVVEEPLATVRPLDFKYRLHHFLGDYRTESRERLLKVKRTDVVRSPDNNQFEMMIYWSSGDEPTAPAENFSGNVKIQTVRGRVIEHELIPAKNNEYRLTLLIEPESPEAPVEMKASLWDGEQQVSETWSGLWSLKVPEYQFPQVYNRTE